MKKILSNLVSQPLNSIRKANSSLLRESGFLNGGFGTVDAPSVALYNALERPVKYL